MENFKVKNRLVYGGYIALLWLLGGLAFYYILNMITQSPEEDSSLLCHYSSYIVIGIVISWMHSLTYYSLMNGILQIRTPHVIVKTLILQNIIKADCHASAKFHLLRGWYNVSLTDQKGKKVYLYTENAKRLIELLKEKNIEMSVVSN